MRIIAIDYGIKNIGIAISDPTGTIATPLKILKHVSRENDAAAVANLARIIDAKLILIGQSFEDDGRPSHQGRSATRFAQALKSEIKLPIVFRDESFTTIDARTARINMGAKRNKRRGHLDSLAAVILLQSYLEEQSEENI